MSGTRIQKFNQLKKYTDEIVKLQLKRDALLNETIKTQLPREYFVYSQDLGVRIDHQKVTQCIRRFYRQESLTRKTTVGIHDGCGRSYHYLNDYIKQQFGWTIHDNCLYSIHELIHQNRACSACIRRQLQDCILDMDS